MNSPSIEQLLQANGEILTRVFPHITLSDYTRALELVYSISSNIRGRHCGNLNDKLSQYLTVVEYARLHSPLRIDNLEIGTLFGGSCLMKLFALKDLSIPGRMVCIDPMTGFYGNETDAFSGVPVNSDVFFENIERFGFSSHDVELRTCRSDAPEAVMGLEERSFATVMIDGDHSYEGIKNDWQRFSPFVADNGFLNIDDYAEPAWPHITRFLDEIAAGPDQTWVSRGVVGTTQIFCRNFVESIDQNKPPESLPAFDQMISATIPQQQLAEDLTHLVDENLHVRLARVYLVLAKESSHKQQFGDCETWLRKSLLFGSSRPDLKFEVFSQLGLCQIAQNLPHKAAGSFQIAMHLPSITIDDIFKSVLQLGNAFVQANEKAKAEALYLNALRNLEIDESQTYDLNVRLGNLYWSNNRLHDAERFFSAALAINGIEEKRRFHPIVGLGKVLLEKKLYVDAERVLQSALAIADVESGHRAKAHIELAKCYHSQQKHNDEAAAFSNAASLQELPSESRETAPKPLEHCHPAHSKIVSDVTYATVREYNRFLDEFPNITYMSGDLKNFQRPWVVDTILKLVPPGGKLLEIGADKCELADLLQKKGYEVWVVDIFDEFGGGVARFEETQNKFPNIRVLRGYFHEIEGIPENYFNAIYSCSVIEHTPVSAISTTFDKIFACLSDEGVSVHSIDFTVQGAVLENYVLVNEVLKCCDAGISAEEIGRQALVDVDTFYLSPAGHYQWRKFMHKNYEEYPFRKVTSCNIISQKISVMKPVIKTVMANDNLQQEIFSRFQLIDTILQEGSTPLTVLQKLELSKIFYDIKQLLKKDSTLFFKDEKIRSFLYKTFDINPYIPKKFAEISCDSIQPMPGSLEQKFLDALRTKNTAITVSEFRPDLGRYRMFLEQNAHFYQSRFGNNPLHGESYFFQKTLEHFITFDLINHSKAVDIMDIGSAGHQYASIIRQAYPGKRVYVQDLCFPEGIKVLDDGFFQIGGSAATLPLDDSSIDFVTFHCSIEHFEQDADIKCLVEIERVLRPGGSAVIIPLHVSNEYTIAVNPISGPFLDDAFIDNAVIPELLQNGNTRIVYTDGMVSRFARKYSAELLINRLLSRLNHVTKEFCTIEIPDSFFMEEILSDKYFNGAYKHFLPHARRCFLKLVKQTDQANF